MRQPRFQPSWPLQIIAPPRRRSPREWCVRAGALAAVVFLLIAAACAAAGEGDKAISAAIVVVIVGLPAWAIGGRS